MDAAATRDETVAVQELLDELDLGISVRRDHSHRGAETLPWTLTVAVPAMTFLTAFLKRFGERTADTAADAVGKGARALQQWLNRLQDARQGRQGVLILTDRDRELDVVIPRDLSPEAYRQLMELLDSAPVQAAGPGELRWTGDSWVRREL